ncbi:MAG: RluA family pseudouridine synthase [Bryobacterales bacterium]|nr:RluA family pseudouridine synthase [Bryobacterales bacterium]
MLEKGFSEGMTEHCFEIGPEEAGDRVDECLARRLPLLSKTKLRALVAQGAAFRSGRKLSIGQRLQPGDVLHFQWETDRIPPGLPEAMLLDVLWEDAWVLAVNKPAGVLVHPTRGVKRGTLTNGILAHLNPLLAADETVRDGGAPTLWPRFVHRLDRDTSGAILVAKDKPTASALGKALAAGEITKTYLAILCGELPRDRFEVREPILRFDEARPHWRTDPLGQPAQSVVEVLSRASSVSLCRLQPLTGRTNQLRIHSASIGAPILGDPLYGGGAAPRLMLHAWKLEFRHPASGGTIALVAAIPQEFRDAWAWRWPAGLE